MYDKGYYYIDMHAVTLAIQEHKFLFFISLLCHYMNCSLIKETFNAIKYVASPLENVKTHL